MPSSITPERALESLLQVFAEQSNLNYETILRYLSTRIWQDEVMRSEIKAMEWAEKQFGIMFASTSGVDGDLVSMGEGKGILVEVTISPTQDLEKKARHSASGYSTYRGMLRKVVGVRIDPHRMEVVETKEIDIPSS